MGTLAINTVTGPISPDDLGVTLMHEHICFGYPGWDGDESIAPFNRELIVDNGVELLNPLKEFGVKSYVDATTIDNGRFPEIYQEISEKTGINIICSTGYYTEGEGAPAYWNFRKMLGDVVSEITELFIKEINVGIGNTGIKAGVIKIGSSAGEITDYETMMFQAAARAQKETGVPIITHTEHGSMGPEQAQLLIAEGADPKRIMIGHMSDNTNIQYQLGVINQGVYCAFDRTGIEVLVDCPYDIEKYAVMIGLIGIGHADKIMISHDTIGTWLGRPVDLMALAPDFVKNWHPTHLFKNIIPFFKKAGVTDEQIKTITTDNPRRLFAGE
ncbi:MAG: phosphotriesterase-related protein [Bacteroidetes bacterium]|nr:phosphotriesterase-related protein [Bacteroidota bacterium]